MTRTSGKGLRPEHLPARLLDAGKISYHKEDFDRLLAYLESLGLPTPQAESQARLLLEEAEAATSKDSPSSPPLGHVISRVESWLTWLCQEARKQALENPGILSLRLRPVLRRHPEIFLQREGFSESVRAAIDSSACSVVPEEAGMTMPKQPIHLPPGAASAIVDNVKPAGKEVESQRRRHRAGFIMLMILAGLTTGFASWVFARETSAIGWTHARLALFTILFLWISFAFWTAVFGWARSLLEKRKAGRRRREGPLPPTAMVMPVHNEDPRRVFAGVTAMRESLEQTGRAGVFDFFVLSDTTDPDIWASEETAFAEMREWPGLSSRLFYRRRPRNVERKAGNIRDFLERWGGRYKYMVVLDADSLMTGGTVVELARRMEDDSQIGILQVPVKVVNQHTLFARLLQFSSALYGNIYRLGFSYWSQNEGNYWGHNAIVRIEAFTRCCRLPTLPGHPPLGGEILSHDFVEAAFMLRRGWKVVVAPDLGGSYEECPANLVEYAKRDERWSLGNLQHLRLVTARGLNLVSRFHMLMGAMSYLASPLWWLFIILSWAPGLAASSRTFTPHEEHSLLFTILVPLSGALTLLLLIKLLAYVAAALRRSEARQYGGAGKLALSVLLETGVSLLLAPILMLFQTTFLINSLVGRKVLWEAQRRDEAGLGFAAAFRAHRLHSLIGLVIAALMVAGGSHTFWWLSPSVAGLIVSAPFSVFLGSASIGRRLRRMGLLLTPQETNPPGILRRRQDLFAEHSVPSPVSPHPFERLIADPASLALHISMLPPGKTAAHAPGRLDDVLSAALRLRPGELRLEDRLALMQDAAALQRLHRNVWQHWPVEALRAATRNGPESSGRKMAPMPGG